MQDAVILVDKPRGWTSFDAVRAIRRMFNLDKVGHAGTLDPQATGLLIVCTGRKTRELESFTGLEKEYVGTFELGVMTPSYDSETDVSERRAFAHITRHDVERAAASMEGAQAQEPPMYSAVKYGGKPLYKYARKGRTVVRQARPIEVKRFEVTAAKIPIVEFRVVCSKGTYIRSLAHDLGQKLGCGATLRSLRRTRIGSWTVEQARSVEQLKELTHTHSQGQPTSP